MWRLLLLLLCVCHHWTLLDRLHALGVDLAKPCNRHNEAPLAVATKLGHRRAAAAIRGALADTASRHMEEMPE